MQVAKIIGLFALSMAIFFLASCVSDEEVAERVRSVDYTDFGSLSNEYGYGGYRLEDFMTACEAVVVFEQQRNTIIANCNGWMIDIENYDVDSGNNELFWCTQITLSREDSSSKYVFGHIKGSMPRVVSQPEQVLVRDGGLRPWKQEVEKTTLQRLITLMTSGNLWEDNDDPLNGLGFSYIEFAPDGQKYIHRADGEKTPMTNGVPSTVES